MPAAHHWNAVIIAHTALALTACVLGAALLMRRKGSASHRRLGRVWVALMAGLALLSFGIGEGHFSWIHGLSVFTLVMLVVGVRHARQGRVQHHRRTMQNLYVGALVLAGLFTLMPGRLLGDALLAAFAR